MPNLLEDGIGWLSDQLKQHAGTSVIYKRGVDEVTVDATVGKTELEVDDGSGVYQRIQLRDYLIPTGDLVLAGNPALPEPGDQVRETQGSQTFVYEVLGVGTEPHFRYSDPFRRILRVHSKHVATEPA